MKTTDLGMGYSIVIQNDETAESPRTWDPISKLCIREHRRDSFPNELRYNIDELHGEYHVFLLDCYEHGAICFSRSGTGMQCQFDTAKGCGFIAIPKVLKTENFEQAISLDEAIGIVDTDLDLYNAYLNGEIYEFQLYKDGEEVDSCGGYYDLHSMVEMMPEEIVETFLEKVDNGELY